MVLLDPAVCFKNHGLINEGHLHPRKQRGFEWKYTSLYIGRSVMPILYCLFTLKAQLLVENLTFQLFPGRFYGFNRSENESLCLRTELVRFGQEIFLAVMDLWVSYTSLLWPSVSSSVCTVRMRSNYLRRVL